MDFNNLLNRILSELPIPVIVGVAAVIMLVYISQFIAIEIENRIENKYKRQIRFFDHKKIWLSVFWCIIVAVSLAIAEFIQWDEVFFYCLFLLGASSLLYEVFLKKLGFAERKELTEDEDS